MEVDNDQKSEPSTLRLWVARPIDINTFNLGTWREEYGIRWEAERRKRQQRREQKLSAASRNFSLESWHAKNRGATKLLEKCTIEPWWHYVKTAISYLQLVAMQEVVAFSDSHYRFQTPFHTPRSHNSHFDEVVRIMFCVYPSSVRSQSTLSHRFASVCLELSRHSLMSWLWSVTVEGLSLLVSDDSPDYTLLPAFWCSMEASYCELQVFHLQLKNVHHE